MNIFFENLNFFMDFIGTYYLRIYHNVAFIFKFLIDLYLYGLPMHAHPMERLCTITMGLCVYVGYNF
jgi:hypothetical protein